MAKCKKNLLKCKVNITFDLSLTKKIKNMKTYLPYYCKKIGIVFVIIAIVLSFIGNINNIVEGFQDGWNSSQQHDEDILLVNSNIITVKSGRIFTWISLAFSFSGFLLYMFSREKIEDEFIQQLRFLSLAKSLLFTWIIVSILFLIDGEIKFEGLYILQFQLVIYVVIYNYYKKLKFI